MRQFRRLGLPLALPTRGGCAPRSTCAGVGMGTDTGAGAVPDAGPQWAVALAGSVAAGRADNAASVRALQLSVADLLTDRHHTDHISALESHRCTLLATGAQREAALGEHRSRLASLGVELTECRAALSRLGGELASGRKRLASLEAELAATRLREATPSLKGRDFEEASVEWLRSLGLQVAVTRSTPHSGDAVVTLPLEGAPIHVLVDFKHVKDRSLASRHMEKAMSDARRLGVHGGVVLVYPDHGKGDGDPVSWASRLVDARTNPATVGWLRSDRMLLCARRHFVRALCLLSASHGSGGAAGSGVPRHVEQTCLTLATLATRVLNADLGALFRAADGLAGAAADYEALRTVHRDWGLVEGNRAACAAPPLPPPLLLEGPRPDRGANEAWAPLAHAVPIQIVYPVAQGAYPSLAPALRAPGPVPMALARPSGHGGVDMTVAEQLRCTRFEYVGIGTQGVLGELLHSLGRKGEADQRAWGLTSKRPRPE